MNFNLQKIENNIEHFTERIFMQCEKHIKLVYNAYFCPKVFLAFLKDQNSWRFAPLPISFLILNILIVSWFYIDFEKISTYEILEKYFDKKEVFGQKNIIESFFYSLRIIGGTITLSLVIYLNRTVQSFRQIIGVVCYTSSYFYGIMFLKHLLGWIPELVIKLFYKQDISLWHLQESIMNRITEKASLSLTLSKYKGSEIYYISTGFDNLPDIPVYINIYMKLMTVTEFISTLLIPALFLSFIVWVIFDKNNICTRIKKIVLISIFYIIINIIPQAYFAYIQYSKYHDIPEGAYVLESLEKLTGNEKQEYALATHLAFLYSEDERLPKQVQFEYLARSSYYGLRSIVINPSSILSISKLFSDERYDEMLDAISQTLDEVEKRGEYNYKKSTSSVRFLVDMAREKRKEVKYIASDKRLSIGMDINTKNFYIKFVP